MTRDRHLTLVVAALCMLSLGITATTLSTMETDPDDVIDFDYSNLPIGEDSAVEQVKRESLQNKRGTSSESSAPEPPKTGSLLSQLAKLVALLLALVVASLAYRYRHHLLAFLRAVRRSAAGSDEHVGTSAPVPWPRGEPADEVRQAWLAMVQRADLDRPWLRTPRECARAASRAGLDAEVVDEITRLFEEVRYGGAPLTEERRHRALEWLRRLGSGTDGRS